MNGRRFASAPTCAALAGALGVAIIVAVGRGAVSISPGEVLAALADRLGLHIGDVSEQKVAILWSVRVPRVLIAAICGAGLASAGAALQGLVRNPLADPSLAGVSGGAALGAVACLAFAGRAIADPRLAPWLVPAAAFGGAMAATLSALRLARVEGRTSGATLLLAGVGLAALSAAGYGLVLYVADEAALRSITFWSLGSCGGATWALLGAAAVPIGVALLLLPRLSPDLDRLALGEAEARHIGVEVERLVRRTAVLVALAVGGAVAACGAIGFVGLVVPYLVRGTIGPAHRPLFAASALGGALLLVVADLASRTLVTPAELPIGVLTALVGAPVLLALVRRGRGGAAVIA